MRSVCRRSLRKRPGNPTGNYPEPPCPPGNPPVFFLAAEMEHMFPKRPDHRTGRKNECHGKPGAGEGLSPGGTRFSSIRWSVGSSGRPSKTGCGLWMDRRSRAARSSESPDESAQAFTLLPHDILFFRFFNIQTLTIAANVIIIYQTSRSHCEEGPYNTMSYIADRSGERLLFPENSGASGTAAAARDAEAE